GKPDEATQAYAGAGRSQAARGRAAAGGRQGDPRGRQGARGLREHVPPLARAVRRDEGGRRQALEGARARERDAQADRREQGGGERGDRGDREGKWVRESSGSRAGMK